MPRYELFRVNDFGVVMDHTVFATRTDHGAIEVAQATGIAGGAVEVWRDGIRIDVVNTGHLHGSSGNSVPAKTALKSH